MLDEAVVGWAADIITCAPLSVRAIKQSVAAGLGLPLDAAIKATYPAEEARKASHDSLEGPLAFAEKRPPRWTAN